MTRWKGSAPRRWREPLISAFFESTADTSDPCIESWFLPIYGDSTSLEPRCWALQRSFLAALNPGRG